VGWGGEAPVTRGGGASYGEGGDGSPNERGDDDDRKGGRGSKVASLDGDLRAVSDDC
jgi:hypothetical protein